MTIGELIIGDISIKFDQLRDKSLILGSTTEDWLDISPGTAAGLHEEHG